MKFSRTLPFNTRRDVWLEVDLAAIEENIGHIRQFVPQTVEIMAVLKADAYGHGSVMVLPILEASGVSMVGVASMDEALQIRNAGFEIPILVLGVTPDWAMHYGAEHDIQMTLFTPDQLSSLARLYDITGQPSKIHIKINTGMHRIGIEANQAAAFIQNCQQSPAVSVEGVFSHFAETSDEAFTQHQIQQWEALLGELKTLPPLRHLSNSSGTWHYPLTQSNLVRIGISLFGYSGDSRPMPFPLKPAMGLKARIVHIHPLPPGESVSYNRTFYNTTDQTLRIATLPLGYADGIPRNLSNRIEGLYRGVPVPQVGIITMDQLMMDITQVPEAQVGDVITLIGPSQGKQISLSDWAACLNTIEYELMCGLRVRLPKTYVRSS